MYNQNNKFTKTMISVALGLALTACGSDTVDEVIEIIADVPEVINSAPTISSTAELTVEAGSLYSYTLASSDADGDTLTLSAANLPAWLSFDDATGMLTGTPQATDVGEHEITLTVNDGTIDTTQSFTITVTEAVVVVDEATPALVVFNDMINPLWAPWENTGGAPPVVITDGDYGEVVQFMINNGTEGAVMGFNARDAVDGVAFDTPAGTTLEFDLKVTNMPDTADTAWMLKLEDAADGFAEVNLNASVEGQVPVLDTWMHYTFDVAELGLANVDLIMIFPAWGTGNGAEFSVDNVVFNVDADAAAEAAERAPGDSGDAATTTVGMGIDFEGPQLTWSSFDTAPVQFVENPIMTGINTSAEVALLDIRKGDAEWAGIRTEGIDTFALDATNCVVKLDVYRNTMGTMHVKFEKDNGDGWGSAGVVTVANTVVDEWETLTFNTCAWIGNAETDAIGGFVIHPDQTAARAEDSMIYIDNIMFSAGAEEVEEPMEPTELVINGGFDDGGTNWNQNSIIDEDGNNIYEGQVATAGNPWDVNLSQVMTLVAGQSYTVSFKAKAANARNIIAGIGMNSDPWTATTEEVAITTEWATYTYTMTPEAGGDNSRVIFDMGAEAGNVYLDDISVKSN